MTQMTQITIPLNAAADDADDVNQSSLETRRIPHDASRDRNEHLKSNLRHLQLH